MKYADMKTSAHLRELHPLRLGDIIDGKPVRMTAWTYDERGNNVPIYHLEGERKVRVWAAKTSKSRCCPMCSGEE